MTNPIQTPAEYAATLYEAGYRATSRSDSDLIVEGLKADYGFLNSEYALEVLNELEEIEFKNEATSPTCRQNTFAIMQTKNALDTETPDKS